MRTSRLALTDREFARLRTVLARSAGLVFDETRRDSVAFGVAQRIGDTGAADTSDYLDRLADPVERQALLDEVTIQETHFFRNPPQVRALRRYVLPELIEQARGRDRRIRIWSAGCSTGEEPYTIAMLLRGLLPSTAGWDIQVVASDVSTRALEVARRGVYGERAVRMAAPSDLARFFTTGPAGEYAVRPEVRELVRLRHHNLVTDEPPFDRADRLDLVLCRNVTIYFGRDTTRALMARLHTVLRDGGYLFLGHSETLWQVSEEFRLVPLGTGDSAAFVYRRIDAPTRERRGTIVPNRRTGRDGPPAAGLDRRFSRRRLHPAAPAPAAPAARAAPARVTSAPAAPAPPASLPPEEAAATVRAAVAEGRYSDAVILATDLLAADPLDARGHYLRGMARCHAADDALAVVDLRRAVYLDPGSGLAHFLLAGVLRRIGDPTAAAREYRAAANTLASRPAEASAPELGGRSVRELAALCGQLSDELCGQLSDELRHQPRRGGS